MKMRNKHNGDVIEVPPPDHLGESVVRFNGRIVESVLYGEDTVTTGDGRTFTPKEWSSYLVEQCRTGWSNQG